MAWWRGKGAVADEASRDVQLPPRGRYETDVTTAQKLKLERLGYRDHEMLAVIGRDQAEYLIHHLEMEARGEEGIDYWADSREFWSNVAAGFCGFVAITVVVLIAWDHFWQGGRFGAHAAPIVETAPAEDATPDPAAPARSMAEFRREVAASQARAVRTYPSLGVSGSHFNVAFVARFRKLTAQHSPRLDSSDWPERLAEECARDVPTAFQ